MKVTQVLCAAGPVDAVTNQGLACRSLFRSWGWEGQDFAPVIAPGMPRGAMRPLRELRSCDGEVTLLHYSGYARGLEPALAGPTPTLLISHNITPSRYFWAHDPAQAVRCELSRVQLADLGRRVQALAAVSEFNAHELHELSGRDAEVIPVLFDRDRLPAPAPPPEGPPTVLFVGRLVPHKRQDLVIRAFARYREQVPRARLTLVGVPLSLEYGAQLSVLAEQLAPGAVSFEHGVSRERLGELYRQSHALLCLSEHEGFCIPLLEAFHFGVPVIARAAGAVPEVAGDAAVLLDEDDGITTVAEVLRIVLADDELRAELRARGERRLTAYDHATTAARLRSSLTRAVAR